MKHLFRILFLFSMLVLTAGESETDLDTMVHFMPLSPFNSAGKYDRALAECERKIRELPSDTQSLYAAYCYKNIVYALRGLHRNDELAVQFERLLTQFPVNLPLLSVISMDDLPFTGYWKDHFFQRAESGFRERTAYSLEQHDRTLLLRAMLSPGVTAILRKADPVTKALFYRNLVKHLAKVPSRQHLRQKTDLTVLPNIQKRQAPPPVPSGLHPDDGERMTAALNILRTLAEAHPKESRIRQAQKEALAFAEALREQVPAEKDPERIVPQPSPVPLRSDKTGDSVFPPEMQKELNRMLNETSAFSPVFLMERALAAILTGQLDPRAVLSLPVNCQDAWGFCYAPEETGDPAVSAFLLESLHAWEEATGQRPTLSEDRIIGGLERYIRMKSFRVRAGQDHWSDADVLAACACAGTDRLKGKRMGTLAPAHRIYPDRHTLTLFGLAMLARAYPETMPEYQTLLSDIREKCAGDNHSARELGAALLLFAERTPGEAMAPYLMKTLSEAKHPDLYAIRAWKKAEEAGIRPSGNAGKIREEIKPDITIHLQGNRLTLHTKQEQTFIRIRVTGKGFAPPLFLRTDRGMLIHNPFCKEGMEYFLCRLPAGETSFPLHAGSTEKAEIIPLHIPR